MLYNKGQFLFKIMPVCVLEFTDTMNMIIFGCFLLHVGTKFLYIFVKLDSIVIAIPLKALDVFRESQSMTVHKKRGTSMHSKNSGVWQSTKRSKSLQTLFVCDKTLRYGSPKLRQRDCPSSHANRT